jgi:hypothetical protein
MAEIDADHGLRAGGHEVDVVETVTAQQMYHDRGGRQQWAQQIQLAPEERRVAGGLQEEILVLTNVLLRRRLPGNPVQLHVRVHVFHYRKVPLATVMQAGPPGCWTRPARALVAATFIADVTRLALLSNPPQNRPGTSAEGAGLLTCTLTSQDRTSQEGPATMWL